MIDTFPTKFSTARRKGDEYEKILLAWKALDLLSDRTLISIRHEAREFVPADDVVVESDTALQCFQAKHANSDHALFDFDDLITDPQKIGLSVERLYKAWLAAKESGKSVHIIIFTNRAAGPGLAPLLDGQYFKQSFLDDQDNKRKRKQILEAAGCPKADEIAFLDAVAFKLRQKNLNELRTSLREERIVQELGLAKDEFEKYLYKVTHWYESATSAPITRGEVLSALGISSSKLSHYFPIDETTYYDRETVRSELKDWIKSVEGGFGAIIGPPGCGKSTLISKTVTDLEKSDEPFIRYFAYTSIHDRDSRARVTRNEFLKSLIDQMYLKYGQVIPRRGRYDYSPEKLHSLLQLLGEEFTKENKHLLVIIDGIDHVSRMSGIERRLTEVIPETLPPGVTMIFGTQNISHLPTRVRMDCDAQHSFNVPLFTIDDSIKYLDNHPSLIDQIGEQETTKIAEISEGLPLYLRYAAEHVGSSEDKSSAIENLPEYSGDIDNYYKTIWVSAEENLDEKKISGLLARIRFLITKENLIELSGIESFKAEEAFSNISHFLKVTDAGCRIFHNSFRDFIEEQLGEGQNKQLDIMIMEHLKKQKGESLWFQHAFHYALLVNDTEYYFQELDSEYVNLALEMGRPLPEIEHTLKSGVILAKSEFDIVNFSRISTLQLFTQWRFDSHIDRALLLKTLYMFGDDASALAAISTGEELHGETSELVEALIALARNGNWQTGYSIAGRFFQLIENKFRPDQSTIPEELSVGYVRALYGRNTWSLDVAKLAHKYAKSEDPLQGGSRGLVFLRSVCNLLLNVGLEDRHDSITQILKKNIKKVPELYADWMIGSAVWRINNSKDPNESQIELDSVKPIVNESRHRIELAGVAAINNIEKAAIVEILGEATLIPPHQNEDMRISTSSDLGNSFRNYIAALIAVDNKDEISTIYQIYEKHNNWASTYWRANIDLVQTVMGEKDVSHLLFILDYLIEHKKAENERIFEVFYAIRDDLPDFLDLLVNTYLRDGGDASKLIEYLNNWHNSELVSLHYGIAGIEVSYLNDLIPLEVASQYPSVHQLLLPPLIELHDRISSEVVSTSDRSYHLIRLSQVAIKIGQREKAREWFSEGIRASEGYGYHKDYTLGALISGMKIANRINPEGECQRIGEIDRLVRWMPTVTDQRETNWFYHRLFEAITDTNPQLAWNILNLYQQNLGYWRFSDVTSYLIENINVNSPKVEYALCEVIDPCSWESGEGNIRRTRGRLISLKRALVNGNDADVKWIAQKMRHMILTEIPEWEKSKIAIEYNIIANENALPLLTEFPMERIEEEAKSSNTDSTTEPDFGWPAGFQVKINSSEYDEEAFKGRVSQLEQFHEACESLQHDNYSYEQGEYPPVRFVIGSQARIFVNGVDSSDALSAVIDSARKFDIYFDYTEIAEKFLGFGDRQGYHNSLVMQFGSADTWFVYEKPIELLKPIFDYSKEEGFKRLIEYLTGKTENPVALFGTPILFAKVGEMVGDGAMALQVYNDFHQQVKQLFNQLPVRENNPLDWLMKDNLEFGTFEQAAIECLVTAWTSPQLHLRERITSRFIELIIAEEEGVLQRLISCLDESGSDVSLFSSMVLESVSNHLPHIIEPFAQNLQDLRAEDFLVMFHVRNTLANLQIQNPDIFVNRNSPVILAGSVSPSPKFRDVYQGTVMRSLRDRISSACVLIGYDEEELLWRIEREIQSLDIDLDDAREIYMDEMQDFTSNADHSIIPIISTFSQYCHGVLRKVIYQIHHLGQISNESLHALERSFNLCDPVFISEREHLSNPDNVIEELPSEINEDWVYEDLTEFEIVPLNGDWIPVYNTYHQHNEQYTEYATTFSALVSTVLLERVKNDRTLLNSQEFNPARHLFQMGDPNLNISLKEIQQHVHEYTGMCGVRPIRFI